MLISTIMTVTVFGLLVTELLRRIRTFRRDLIRLRQFPDARRREALYTAHAHHMRDLAEAVAHAPTASVRRRAIRAQQRTAADWHHLLMQWDAWNQSRAVWHAIVRSRTARLWLGVGLAAVAALLVVVVVAMESLV